MAVSSTFLAGDGEGYEAQMGRWSRRLAPLFISFAGVTSGRVLDVGCGTGNLTLALTETPAFERVTGVDFSSVYIEHARQRTMDPRVAFQTGDACALPLESGSFDHALSMLVLQFIPEAERAVREMRRVTRPGGTVAAATWDTRGGLVYYRMFFDTAAQLGQQANERRARAYSRPMSKPGELARAWQAAGLTDISDGTLTIRMDFASFADYWTPVEGRDGPLADYVRTLDEPTKAKLRELVKLAYLDGDPDGPRSYAATAWVVRGVVPQ
jgi:ubiquinone/menaquinone biosynthesis C-methylase UbiE